MVVQVKLTHQLNTLLKQALCISSTCNRNNLMFSSVSLERNFSISYNKNLRQFKSFINHPFQQNSKTSHSIDKISICCRKMSKTTLSSTTSGTEEVMLEKPAQLAIEIFQKAVESVKPYNLLKTKFIVENNILRIDDEYGTKVNLNHFNRIFVVGFGKAVLPMAEAVMKALGNRIDTCMVNIPFGFREANVKGIVINHGAKSNLPDEAAYQGTKKIVQLVQDCKPDDLLIVLISGGGSALLSYPLFPITVKELGNLVKTLSRGGATIQELNSVRKRLSLVKGGGLLSLCQSSKIISLILSDVLGDPIDVIASGPTVPNPDSEALAKEIINKYMNYDTLPKNIKQVLDNPVVSPASKDVTNSIIGNNSIALSTAAAAAKQMNLYPVIITNILSGDASQVGEDLGHFAQAASYILRAPKDDEGLTVYTNIVRNIAQKLKLKDGKINEMIASLQDENVRENYKGICLLFGGETTVQVKGAGVGGRNQELALSAGIKIDTCSNNYHVKGKIAVLSAGTDGIDGPCDAAGAVIDSNTLKNGYLEKLSATGHRLENDYL